MSNKLALFDALIDRTLKHMMHMTNSLQPTDDERLTALGKKYGLVVITDANKLDDEITFGPINEVERRICFELFEQELSIYDPEILKRSQFERLILCTDLRDKGDPVNGLAEIGRFVVDSLVFNASGITRQWERARATLHHEIFHAIDYRDDVRHFLDPEWRILNGEDYRYNDSLQFTAGEYYSDAVYFPPFSFRNVEKIPAGFLNEYGTQSVHEDKAIFYSWLIVRYNELQKICAQDAVVAAKVAYMQALLAKFHDSFNDNFWARMDHQSSILAGSDYDEWKERLPRANAL